MDEQNQATFKYTTQHEVMTLLQSECTLRVKEGEGGLMKGGYKGTI